jgi:hypothetical protein
MSTCTCAVGTLTSDPTLGQICVQPKTSAGACPDATWASLTSTTCQKTAGCTCACTIGTLTTDPTLGQICIQPKTPAGTCTDATWTSLTSTTCRKAPTCTKNAPSTLPATTISTTANYCGDQYNNKGCACVQQVTAGLTPSTESAANTTLICAYQENGIQYGCDAGCCPGGTCSGSPGTSSAAESDASTSDTSTAATTKEPNGSLYWAMVALSIMYALLLVFAVGFASTRR